jgi:putative heme-binding domain-containing protein
MRKLIFWLALSLALPLAAQDEEEGRRRPDLKNPMEGKPEAVDAGRKLYMVSCAACHGPNAEGGRGPRLLQSSGVRGMSNRRLYSTIKDGVKGTDMPPSTLAEDRVWEVVTYVRELNAPAFESRVPGDGAAGERLFTGKAGCANCHSIRGKGGFLGPDLSTLGLTRTATQIREAILKPDERITEGYRGIAVTLANGTKISGVSRDYTNYSAQVLDAKGRIHSLDMRKVKQVELSKGSLMPGDFETRLTKEELTDLVAYLSKQVVRVPVKEEETRKESN